MNFEERIIDKVFTEVEDGINIEVKKLTTKCIESTNRNFSLDCEGNLSVNSITTKVPISISSDVLDTIYPIGTYYETSDDNFNPNTTWTGTWELDSQGLVTVSQDITQTEFYNLGQTGGSKFLQDHNHKTYISGGGTQAADCTGYLWDPSTARPYPYTTSVTNIETGHSGNLQPYIVVKRWHRVA